MEIERDKIKKTFFGNYRPEEVDRLLNEMEELLRQQEEERAEEAALLEAEREETERLSAALRNLQETVERLVEENSGLEDLNKKLGEECAAREEEGRSLRGEMESLQFKMENMQTEMELANSQNSILSSRVARQRRELEEKDKLLLADPVGEANKRAEQIIQNAMETSKTMLDNAENMRSRALAAVRAAFFNTMSFRQNMEDRFVNLQNDLDQSMRTLRAIEAEDESKTPGYIQEKW